MQTSIAKWGNSLALRLPRHVAQGANLSVGSPVELTVRDGSVVVTPVRKKYSLDELLAQMNEEQRHQETDWGQAQGKEEW